MQLNNAITFQKALALAASATTPFEAEAAEAAARRLMATFKINPTRIPDLSMYNHINFADNALLQKLREEWLAEHPPPPRRQRPPPEPEEPMPSIPFSLRGYRKVERRNKKDALRRRSAADNSVAAAMIRKWVYEEPDISTKELEQRLQVAQQPRNFDTIGAIRANTQRVLLELNEMGYLTEPLANRLRS
jgi:hypothetical protein